MHFPQKIYKLSKTKSFFSRFEGRRGEKTQIFRTLEAENVVRMREEAYNQELLKLQTELDKHRRMQKKDSGASSTGDFF